MAFCVCDFTEYISGSISVMCVPVSCNISTTVQYREKLQDTDFTSANKIGSSLFDKTNKILLFQI